MAVTSIYVASLNLLQSNNRQKIKHMGKSLVIVESPAKARTIERILKRGYEVRASYGHVRDLPESATEIPDAIRKKK